MSEYKIGDIVPYKNTRGNIKLAKITSLEIVQNGKTWFKGISIETEAKVFYPEHISRKLTKQFINTNDIMSFDLQNIIELLPKFINIEDKLESFILYIDIENCSVRYTRDILGKKFNLKIITAVNHDNILLLLFELLVWVLENRYMK